MSGELRDARFINCAGPGTYGETSTSKTESVVPMTISGSVDAVPIRLKAALCSARVKRSLRSLRLALRHDTVTV